ncbi:MAG: hypothetical protein ACRD0F_08590 [Acidimicrobiales bacterium]
MVIAAALLTRTATLAESINSKAEIIAKTGRGINTATDAVLQLDRTNAFASSILATAQPLESKLNDIIRLAKSIDGLATTINGTAGSINGTARGINGTAGNILGTAQSINRGVEQINRNLEDTLALAGKIKTDTGNILGNAREALSHAACIDQALNGVQGTC